MVCGVRWVGQWWLHLPPAALPRHAQVEALCSLSCEGEGVRMLRKMGECGVLPLPDSLVHIAAACGRRKASGALAELVELLQVLKLKLPIASFKQAAAACVAAGASEILPKPSQPSLPSSSPLASGGGEERREEPAVKPSRLSTGASDAKAARGLQGTQVEALTRERDQLRTRVAQLMKIVSRRTRCY